MGQTDEPQGVEGCVCSNQETVSFVALSATLLGFWRSRREGPAEQAACEPSKMLPPLGGFWWKH
jgi:hypothetical protein